MLSLCSEQSWLWILIRSLSRCGAKSTTWLVILLLAIGGGMLYRTRAATAAQAPLGVVSAASFSTPIAPDSIASAFGTDLATGVIIAPSVPLPTALDGTTLTVNDQIAGLFFVSSSQINFLVPKTVAAGTATVEVRLNGVVKGRGTVEIRSVAPGIFTANASGLGCPAAQVYRASPTPQFVYECVEGRSPRCLPRSIDICVVNGQVVFVLYLTGLRGAPDPNNDGNVNESVLVNFGGTSVKPSYAGAQPGFVGLDQINVEAPAGLANFGRITVTVTAPEGVGSNPVDLEFTSTGTVQVNNFNPNDALAGQVVNITGAGFSTAKERNLVRINGADVQAEAQVVDATPDQLTVLIPFGVQTGKVSVTNLEGGCFTGTGSSSNNMGVRTSVSGFFKDTSGRKLKGVTVKVKDATGVTKTGMTNDDGAFIIPDPAPSVSAEVEIDGGTVQGALPFPKVLFKMRIAANQDNELKFPGSLQGIVGASSFLDPDGKPDTRLLSVAVSPDETQGRITNGEVILDIPDNSTIRFPDGTPAGNITLSLVARSLTPVPLPERHFSSTIVQIAPLGATIIPGAKLTFPNSDGFTAGQDIRLFRLDQRRGSDTLGTFIDSGPATLLANGKIETPAGAVTETTYYFVSVQRPLVTVVGNVVEIDQVPVRRALLGSRGQSGFTDGNGGFVVRNVPINSATSLLPDGAVVMASSDGQVVVGADVISLEANYLRPTRLVSRKENNNVPPASAGNTTSAGVLVLDPPPPDNPPKITAPSTFRVFAGQAQNLDILVTRGGGQSVTVTVTGAGFVTLTEKGNDTYTLRISPGVNDVGNYTLVITAVNDIGRVATHRISPLTVSP